MHFLRHLTKDPIRLALALSLILHVAALWKMPAVRPPVEPESPLSMPLVVRLAPPPRPPAPRPQPPVRVQPPPATTAPRSVERPPARPPPRPPVLARRDPAPEAPPVPRPQPAPAPAVTPLPGTDLASYIDARRRSR